MGNSNPWMDEALPRARVVATSQFEVHSPSTIVLHAKR